MSTPTSSTLPGDSTTTTIALPGDSATSTTLLADTATTVPTTPVEELVEPAAVECAPTVELVEVPGWAAQATAVSIAAIPEPEVGDLETDPLAAEPGELPPDGPSEPSSTETPEDFLPQADPPEEVVTPPASVIQPAFPRSDEVYTVVAKVSAPDTLASLSTVTMCWYKADSLGVVDGIENGPGSSDCSRLDPRYNFKMTWNEADGNPGGTAGFSLGAANNYLDAGSRIEMTPGAPSYDGSGLEMTVHFSFKVSSAMSAGSDWSVSVSASFDADPITVVAVDTRSNLTVAYWGNLFTTKQSIDFGLVAPGGSSNKAIVSLGTYRANGPTDYSLQGSDYACTSTDCASIVLRAADNSSSDGIDLECTLNESTVVRLGTDVRHVASLDATGEAEETIDGMSCTLLYRGGAELAFAKYSGPILVSISPAPTS